MTDDNLRKIYLSSLKFLTPLTPEKTYATIVGEAVKLVKAEWGAILLEQDGHLRRVYSSNPFLFQTTPRKNGYLFNAFKTGKPAVLSSRGIEKVHTEIKKLSIASDVIIPLSYRSKSIGILAILSKREEKLNHGVVDTLILFGSMASLAIRKAQLYEETRKALETRDLFISMAAHELRTPLTTISGYSQLLYSKLSGANTPESRWVAQLSWETYRLTQLVNELLEVERIQNGEFRYSFKECSLKEIIGRVMGDFRFTHADHTVIFDDKLAVGKDTIIGDFDKLIQLIINLLDNAAKFTPAGSEILLSLKQDQSNFIIKIKDKGKGIAKKELDKVCDRFYKGAGTSHEGLGLGLFLVKNIAKQHHGSLHMRSRLEKGTTVEIKLPKAKT